MYNQNDQEEDVLKKYGRNIIEDVKKGKRYILFSGYLFNETKFTRKNRLFSYEPQIGKISKRHSVIRFGFILWT